jgi:hypothetical protein
MRVSASRRVPGQLLIEHQRNQLQFTVTDHHHVDLFGYDLVLHL